MIRFYIWRPDTQHWHDATTDAVVEWHEWGEYRFSFDISDRCSRFIVVKPRQLRLPNGELVDGPKQIAAGLIEPPRTQDASPVVRFDEPPTEELPYLLPLVIGDEWLAMRHRLKQQQPPGE